MGDVFLERAQAVGCAFLSIKQIWPFPMSSNPRPRSCAPGRRFFPMSAASTPRMTGHTADGGNKAMFDLAVAALASGNL